MNIRLKQPEPSRPDAMRMTRSEKISMMYLMHAVGTLENICETLEERLRMIPSGKSRANALAGEARELLDELRVTVPMNQRQGMERTACDVEVRIMPRLTPTESNVVMCKENFRELIEKARVACRECTEDDFACEKCELFQLLTVEQPVDNYNSLHLCPYNLAEWKN